MPVATIISAKEVDGRAGLRDLRPLLLFLLAASLTAILFWPAIWSNDTVSQFEQARRGSFTSHHPPIMAALLRPFALLHLERVMILLQAMAFWGMVWLLFSAFRGAPRKQRIRALYPIILPSSIALIGIIWKDVHLALAWGMAWTLLLVSRRRGVSSRILLPAAAMLILYGLLVRHNAFIAVAPLVLLLVAGKPWLGRPVLTLAAYAAISLTAFAAAQTLNRSLIVDNDVPTAQMSLPIFDLAGVSTQANRNAFPFAMSRQQLAQVQRCYRPVRWDSLYFERSPCRWLMDSMLAYEASGKSVRGAWLKAIAQEPAAYLRHRAAFVSCLLTYAHGPGETTHRAVFAHDLASDPVPGRTVLIYAYLAVTNLWEQAGLLTPLAALAWGALLVWFMRRDPELPFVAGAVLTAFLNILSHFPFGVASDQRYSYPSFLLLALATAAAALLVRRSLPLLPQQAPRADGPLSTTAP